MDDPRPNQPQRTGSGLKIAWFLFGLSFVISLVASITMIAQTINWLRHRGGTVPGWFNTMTRLSEWIFALSCLGLLVLVLSTIFRNYREP